MPRNGSGTASIIHDFTPLTTIESSAVDENNLDIAEMLTNSLPVDGQKGMTGQLKAVSGDAQAPGISFGVDRDTGIFRKGSGALGVSSNGTEVAAFSASGISFSAGANFQKSTTIPNGSSSSPGMKFSSGSGFAWISGKFRAIVNGVIAGTFEENGPDTSGGISIITQYKGDKRYAQKGRSVTFDGSVTANSFIVNGDNAVLDNRTISTSHGIAGGGDLSGNRTITTTGYLRALYDSRSKSSGFIARTGSSSVSTRSISGGDGITVSNGNGLSGNPSISVSNDVWRDGRKPAAIDLSNILATTNANAVNSIVMATRIDSGAEKVFGDTIVGSKLRPSNAKGQFGGGTLPGIWMCMGYSRSSGSGEEKTTIWRRVS